MQQGAMSAVCGEYQRFLKRPIISVMIIIIIIIIIISVIIIIMFLFLIRLLW